jgi:hypothetical protein
VLIGVPNLTPSDRTQFDAAVDQLQAASPAEPPTASR